MPRKLLKHQDPINRITWFTTWNYALRNYYNDNIDYVPNPVTGNDRNSPVKIISDYPNIATVDWGDGNVEQYSFYKTSSGNYCLYFRSLNCPQYKSTSGYMGWAAPASGEKVRTVDPHHYADDRKDIQRAITVSFSNEIASFRINAIKMTAMPILEAPALREFSLTDTYYIRNFVFDKLENSPNLSSMEISKLLYSSENAIDNRTKKIPEGVIAMTNLYHLSLTDVFDFRQVEESGIRKISNLKNMKELNISNNGISRYLKEYNDLPSLSYLSMYEGYTRSNVSDKSEYCSIPNMDEVESINPKLSDFYWIAGWDGGNVVSGCWFESVEGKGLQNLTTFYLNLYNQVTPDSFPEYFKEMRACSYFKLVGLFKSQSWADMVPVTLYNYMKGWDLLTMSATASDGNRNQFYGARIEGYVAANADYGTYVPSGSYAAPAGFEPGVSDGQPSTPMEYVYVLVNNYHQTWILYNNTIKPLSRSMEERWYLMESSGKAIITDGEIKTNDDVEVCSSFEEALNLAHDKGLDIFEYRDNPFCSYGSDFYEERIGGGYSLIISILPPINIRKEVRYAA